MSDDAPLVIIYTSGTTGLPKGAVHTHASVRANIDNSATCADVSGTSVCLTVLPTFHVAGLNLFANPVLFHGGTAVVMMAFDAAQVLELLCDPKLAVTHLCGVPANYQFMSALPHFEQAPLRPFIAAVGGSPVPRPLVDFWRRSGIPVMSVFGITEAGSTVMPMPPDVVPSGLRRLPLASRYCTRRVRYPRRHRTAPTRR